MPITINIHEAKTHLSKLLQRVIAGEEIILAKAGKPVARIVPFTSQRVPGSAQGQIWIAPDFDVPLPEDLLATFAGT